MDVPRILAGGLAVNRVLFGLGYALRPRTAGPSWIGRSARRPGTQVIIRSQAIRDVALGGGALLALARGASRDAQVWMAGHALADGADFVVTWAARGRLPRRSAQVALAVAGVSTAVAAAAAAGLRPGADAGAAP